MHSFRLHFLFQRVFSQYPPHRISTKFGQQAAQGGPTRLNVTVGRHRLILRRTDSLVTGVAVASLSPSTPRSTSSAVRSAASQASRICCYQRLLRSPEESTLFVIVLSRHRGRPMKKIQDSHVVHTNAGETYFECSRSSWNVFIIELNALNWVVSSSSS